MRGVKRSPWLSGLGVLLLAIVVGYGGAVRADVTSDDTGSIIIFPKVVADGTRDTLIQLANRTNMTRFLQCFYIDSTGTCSATTTQVCREDGDCPDAETCDGRCSINNDFQLILTAQQPVIWRASTGRAASSAPPCRIGQPCQCTIDTHGAQHCPGLILAPLNGAPFAPPVGTHFLGELKCVEVDSPDVGANPLSGNAFKGEATIEDLTSKQISEYNALAIQAININNGGPTLGLWNTAGEYNACPRSLVFTTYGDGAVDTFTNTTVRSELTLVPCTEVLEAGVLTPAIVNFAGWNEFEDRQSADGVDFECFFNRDLGHIPSAILPAFTSGGGDIWKIRVTPSSDSFCLTGSRRAQQCTTDDENATTGCPGRSVTSDGTSLGCRASTGVLGVLEEFYTPVGGGAPATAAVNVYQEGDRSLVFNPDVIVLP